jgi:hypothetical protein
VRTHEPQIDRTAILTAIYQAERADNSAVFTNTLAILGFAITYVAAVLGFVVTASSLHGVLLAFAPAPACALVAYHQVMVGMNGARAAATQRLEWRINALLGDQGLAVPRKRDQRRNWTKPARRDKDLSFGILIGEQFLDISIASRARILGAAVPYVTLFLATLGFTVFMLARAYHWNAGGLAMVLGSLCAAAGLAGAGWNMLLNARRPESNSFTGADTAPPDP